MLTYERIAKQDIDVATALYEEYLNAGDHVRAHLRRGFAIDGYVGIKCMDGNTVAGIFSACPGVYFTYTHPELEAEVKGRWPENIYTMDMLAIRREYRGMGIARRLTKDCCDILIDRGVEHFLVELWIKPNGDTPSGGVVKYMGTGAFEEKWTILDFYKDLHLYHISCPVCGDGPCVCGALVGVVRL